MKIGLLFAIICCFALSARCSLRPPSVPLLLQSPEVNVWSNSDTLQSSVPTRWEGSSADLASIARVNGESFLLMGSPHPAWSATPLSTATQTSVTVKSTRTSVDVAHLPRCFCVTVWQEPHTRSQQHVLSSTLPSPRPCSSTIGSCCLAPLITSLSPLHALPMPPVPFRYTLMSPRN
jgi:hypothetical protein